MTRYERHVFQPLYIDDTRDDMGSFGLSHMPKSLDHRSPVLTRSIERPAVRAGTPCPRCVKGSMFVERQMHDEPELVCQSCGSSEVTVDLPALLELSEELEINEIKRNGQGGNTRWNQPNRNGEEM